MPRCFIFGALPVNALPVVPAAGDPVIAADRGYAHAASLGINPDVVVGDFDSLGSVPDAGELIRLNVRKDDTDLDHAVGVALERGWDDIVVYGAVGGKLDHTLGNIAVAERAALAGAKILFIGEDSSFTVIRNTSFTLPARDSGRISVLSLDAESRGVHIAGLSYEADGVALRRASTVGVSNAFVGKPSRIAVEDGTLLIVFDTQE